MATAVGSASSSTVVMSDGRGAPNLADGGPASPGPRLALVMVIAGMATVGLTALRAGGWLLADLFFLAAAGVISGQLLMGMKKRIAPPIARKMSPLLLVGLVVLTVGGLLATMTRSWDPVGSLMVVVRLWYVTIIWFWTMRAAVMNLRDLRRLLFAFVVGAGVNAVVGLIQEVSGANAGEPTWGRSVGLTDHFNALGTSLAAAIPIALVWQPLRRRTARLDRLRSAGVLLLFAGIGVSGSMTAFGSALVGVVVALVAGAALGVRTGIVRSLLVPVAALMAGAVLLIAGVVNLPVLERFQGLREGRSYEVSSAESRGDMARIAVEGVVDSPLIGVGLDITSGRRGVSDEGSLSTHSLYLRLAYEAGILGLAGLALIMLSCARQAFAILTRTGRQVHWMGVGLVGSLAAVSTNAIFSPILYERFFWAAFGLVGVVFGLARAGQVEVTPARSGAGGRWSRPPRSGVVDKTPLPADR